MLLKIKKFHLPTFAPSCCRLSKSENGQEEYCKLIKYERSTSSYVNAQSTYINMFIDRDLVREVILISPCGCVVCFFLYLIIISNSGGSLEWQIGGRFGATLNKHIFKLNLTNKQYVNDSVEQM